MVPQAPPNTWQKTTPTASVRPGTWSSCWAGAGRHRTATLSSHPAMTPKSCSAWCPLMPRSPTMCARSSPASPTAPTFSISRTTGTAPPCAAGAPSKASPWASSATMVRSPREALPRPPSSSSSATRHADHYCSFTTPPASWWALMRNKTVSSSTARKCCRPWPTLECRRFPSWSVAPTVPATMPCAAAAWTRASSLPGPTPRLP